MEKDAHLKKLAELAELGEIFEAAMEAAEKKQEEYWKSLTLAQQLDVFCCVVRRIHEGEIQKKSSYRGVLYEVFGFGPEAYGAAQQAGYIDIHNSLCDENYDRTILTSFCEQNKISNHLEKIEEFLK